MPNIIIIGLVSLAPWVFAYVIGHVDVAGFSPRGRGVFPLAQLQPSTHHVLSPTTGRMTLWSYGNRPLRASAWKTLLGFYGACYNHPVKRPGRSLVIVSAARHLSPD